MTRQEANEMLAKLTLHFGCRVAPVSEYCDAFDTYFKEAKPYLEQSYPEVVNMLPTLRMVIEKSCFLKRLIYGGEKLRMEKCPVHNGTWSGISLGWPGTKWSDGTPVKIEPTLQAHVDAGCKCYTKCCTTGWQPADAS